MVSPRARSSSCSSSQPRVWAPSLRASSSTSACRIGEEGSTATAILARYDLRARVLLQQTHVVQTPHYIHTSAVGPDSTHIIHTSSQQLHCTHSPLLSLSVVFCARARVRVLPLLASEVTLCLHFGKPVFEQTFRLWFEVTLRVLGCNHGVPNVVADTRSSSMPSS